MPGSTPATSQLDWLISITAMIVLFWSRATRDLLKSFGWGIAALHRLPAATKLPFPRSPPHSFSRAPRAHDGTGQGGGLAHVADISEEVRRAGAAAESVPIRVTLPRCGHERERSRAVRE